MKWSLQYHTRPNARHKIKEALYIQILTFSSSKILLPWIRGPREMKEGRRQGGTSGRTRQASAGPHQSNDKVQNPDFPVIG